MSSLILQAPAKINLYLRLTGPRKDGYNNLCAIFQKISLKDTLTFTKASKFSLTVEGNACCSLRDNLIARAYRLLKKEVGFKNGASIVLKKNIPVGAGLGGASSDAAATLRGVNKLSRLGLKKQDLISLGRKIGADVPFFIHPFTSALGIERGDMLLNLNYRNNLWILLVAFNKGLLTRKVYRKYRYNRKFQLNLTKITREVIMLSQFFHQGDIVSLGGLLKNDLYAVSRSLHPEMECVMKNMKRCGVRACAMSGSGPTLFALFKTRKDAERAEREVLSYREVKTIICRTIN